MESISIRITHRKEIGTRAVEHSIDVDCGNLAPSMVTTEAPATAGTIRTSTGVGAEASRVGTATRFESSSWRRRPKFSSEMVTDHVVIDHTTGLMWSRYNVTEGRVSLAAAEQACNDLELHGHNDWRLPTRAELLSLVDDTRSHPAIDTAAFPNCASNWYWTATESAAGSSYAWIVNFYDGNSYNSHRGNNNAFVRAVRSLPAGQ